MSDLSEAKEFLTNKRFQYLELARSRPEDADLWEGNAKHIDVILEALELLPSDTKVTP